MNHYYHLIPINDVVPHADGRTTECVCGPDLEYFPEAGNYLVKHNSLDGREFLERGEQIPKEKR